jgi:hypothetical protein
MVIEHALIDAAGDRQHSARLVGGDRGPARWGRRPPKVVAVKHEGRRISIRVHVVLRPTA